MAARRLAIVTGGNRGIGKEIARQLLKHDLSVVVGCRSQEKCAATLAELGADGETIAAYVLDVNDTKSVRRFVEEVDRNHGKPGVLVNNAGVEGTGIPVNSMSPGWVQTDMGGAEAPRDVAEGADTAVWLALLPRNGPTGQFFRDRKAIPW